MIKEIINEPVLISSIDIDKLQMFTNVTNIENIESQTQAKLKQLRMAN